MANTCDILGWVNHFAWSYLPYRWARGLKASAWKVCFREASAKNMNTVTKNIPWSLPPCVCHGSCRTYCRYVSRYAVSSAVCIYKISLYDVHMKCKRQNHTILQDALPRNFNIKKNMNLFPRVSTTAVGCRCLIHVQTLHSEDDSIKNRNSIVKLRSFPAEKIRCG